MTFQFKTLTNALAHHGRQTGNPEGITFIEAEDREEFLPYTGLYEQACRVLAGLRNKGVQPGSEVLLQFQTLKNFVILFWACILGKMIPVPLTFVRTGDIKFLSTWEFLQDPYLITDYAEFDRLLKVRADMPGSAIIPQIKRKRIYYAELRDHDETAEPLEARSGDIAFIQFSSGSTGRPKGVVDTHRALLGNIRDIEAVVKPGNRDRFLNWMPLTHDLGLIMFHLLPLVYNKSQFLMPTHVFVRRPSLWMTKTAEHRATILGSPNFGYHHFLNNVRKETLKNRRLDCIRFIINGAEPISEQTCRAFTSALSAYGMNPDVIRPAYGLAEAALVVTLSPSREPLEEYHLHRDYLNPGDPIRRLDPGDENSLSFVELGIPVGTELQISGKKDQPLPQDTVGYIKVKGPGVMPGYYNNPLESANAFDRRGWLNTGDLGFISGGRLVMTGRAKELIIVGGINYYPHDIERALEDISGLGTNRVAAVGISDVKSGREEVLLFIRFKKPKDGLCPFIVKARQARERILQRIGIIVDRVIPVPQIPKTTSGKLQRFKLARDYAKGVYRAVIEEIRQLEQRLQENEAPRHLHDQGDKRTEIRDFLLETVKRLIGCPEIDINRGLMEQGFTSLKAIRFQEILNKHFNLDLPISVTFDYPSISALTEYILNRPDRSASGRGTAAEPASLRAALNEPVAVTGMACRFPPDIDTPEAFWELLQKGIDTITEIPIQRWDYRDFYSENQEEQGKMYVKHGSFLSDVDGFDSSFFSITPKEAGDMDPRQRILLEVCYRALENAGVNIDHLNNSRTGVFIGIGSSDYARSSAAGYDYRKINQYTYTGSAVSTAVGRISYFFGLQGPNFPIDTACSSSLVAVHNALRSLRTGESDLVLAGGINLLLSPDGFVASCKLTALSRCGKVRSFDDGADGYVRGEGCGIIVLKRLSDARRDKDNILALVKGSAVNHDGKSSGLTAPNGLAQQRVIARALADAGILPGQVDYVEAHGSGTKIGDPQEVEALNAVYGGSRENTLLIGSVKSNIGHLETAAGIAGLIKIILALRYKKIPAGLHYVTPNRHIPWDRIPIAVVDRLTGWPVKEKNRFAGISSFGLSGTNVHMIVTEAPASSGTVDESSIPIYMINLSAKTGGALTESVRRYVAFLGQESCPSMRDIAYTTILSRGDFKERISLTGSSRREIRAVLSGYLDGRKGSDLQQEADRELEPGKMAFLFPGQGAAYPGMAAELYDTVPGFRAEMDRCDHIIEPLIDDSIMNVIKSPQAGVKMKQPVFSHLALFAIEYALTAMWLSFGIRPSILGGYGTGEYAAACFAGVFDLETALKLVHKRAQLMGAAAGGTGAPGKTGDFAAFIRDMKIEFRDPAVPFVSGVTGKETRPGELNEPRYWLDNMSRTIRLHEIISTLKQKGCRIVLEQGPASVLNDGGGSSGENDDMLWLVSLNKTAGDLRQVLRSLGRLYVHHIDPDWQQIAPLFAGKKTVLPGYPMEKKKFPFVFVNPNTITGSEEKSSPLPGSFDEQLDMTMSVIERQFKIMEQQLESLDNPLRGKT